MQPKDETNHIFYKSWKDRGGNIGVQCTFNHVMFPVTFWTDKETPGEIYLDEKEPAKGTGPCFNCQSIVKADILKIENENHQKEEEGSCQHQPSQPE